MPEGGVKGAIVVEGAVVAIGIFVGEKGLLASALCFFVASRACDGVQGALKKRGVAGAVVVWGAEYALLLLQQQCFVVVVVVGRG